MKQTSRDFSGVKGTEAGNSGYTRKAEEERN